MKIKFRATEQMTRYSGACGELSHGDTVEVSDDEGRRLIQSFPSNFVVSRKAYRPESNKAMKAERTKGIWRRLKSALTR